MRRRRLKLALGVCAAVIAVTAGVVIWALLREPGADSAYDTTVQSPQLLQRRPRVLFDTGHRNAHSPRGRYGPFCRLIESDGCRVSTHRSAFDAAALRACDILVIVNGCGPGDGDQRTASPFDLAECAAIRKWVEGGGSLLLVADHHPYGEAAAKLANEFGVEMSGGWTDDEKHARAGSGDPGQLLFSRENGLLGEHAITRGVNLVETFTGQSLRGPAGAVSLMTLAETAVDRVPKSSSSEEKDGVRRTTFQTDDLPAGGRSQGLALQFGKGRIVVLGESAMLTAQVDDKTGRKFGMNAAGNDDREFALNVVRWLGGAGGGAGGRSGDTVN